MRMRPLNSAISMSSLGCVGTWYNLLQADMGLLDRGTSQHLQGQRQHACVMDHYYPPPSRPASKTWSVPMPRCKAPSRGQLQ